jgi:hypothetical protein
MPKTPKQLTQPELPLQLPQMPSQRMETKKPQSPKRLWLLTGVLVLMLIVIVAVASQASKSSQSTKTPTQAAHPRVGQAQSWYLAHDTHEPLTVAPSAQN